MSLEEFNYKNFEKNTKEVLVSARNEIDGVYTDYKKLDWYEVAKKFKNKFGSQMSVDELQQEIYSLEDVNPKTNERTDELNKALSIKNNFEYQQKIALLSSKNISPQLVAEILKELKVIGTQGNKMINVIYKTNTLEQIDYETKISTLKVELECAKEKIRELENRVAE